jgi:thiamine-phosphate pyrophosphorylase
MRIKQIPSGWGPSRQTRRQSKNAGQRSVIRCLITDGTYAQHPAHWMAHVALWINRGVELVQIRERDLTVRDLAELTRQVLQIRNLTSTKIIVNDRADVALACQADGVHLRDGSVAPDLFARPGFLVTVACHSPDEPLAVIGASYVLLAPIFKPLSKPDDRPALGTEAIRNFARRCSTPVLALGGIDNRNAQACVDAGAAGIAGITCFGL